ncbi:zinc-dependent metalloprotease [Pedobacter sp. KBW06]|uniref:zinc-dependent metalloprotease n=1 Tax=Pedobacter sp. KBW06 TaxID=2153359 RepID=UPI001F3DC4FC|nr:zinc-dependent metalloprotease [Pedobacter sp. KBW06]
MNFRSTLSLKNSSLNKAAVLIMLSAFTIANGYAQKTKWPGSIAGKSKQDTTAKTAEIKKSNIKKFSEVIPAGTKADGGLFNIYKVDQKYYYEIPDSLLGREMLVVTRFTQTPVALKESRAQYGGEMINNQVWKWERRDKQIFIRVPSYTYVADPSSDLHQALENSNALPILAVFDIKAFSSNGKGILIDITDFYNGDIPGMSLPEGLKKTYKISGIDNTRSYVDTVKSFPQNVEVKTVKTYRSPELPADKSVGAMTFGLNTSMVLLPKDPMKARTENKRIGYFTERQLDFSVSDKHVTPTAYIQRWRLEPKDEAAYSRGELVEPKKQIVYYIDPATPKKWVPFLIQGVNDWNTAFEAAGFKNAIVAKEAPTAQEDPEFSTEDARYSVIRYFASSTENAYGPRIADPRSGEIMESHIGWYHNVMSLLRSWFFVQTAAINPAARGTEISDAQMGQLVRFVSSHEVGHTLGLLHNFGSSAAFPVDSLRSKTFTAKYGTAPSIMDYARFNYIAQPGDGITEIYPKIGAYDQFAIKFGYTYFPAQQSVKEEKKILDAMIMKKSKDPVYFYGKQGSIDPRAQSEDLGDNAMKASTYGIENLKRILPNIEKWTYEPGKELEDANDLYYEVIRQYRRYVNHVVANISGLQEDIKTVDEPGAVYSYTPKAKQQQAIAFLNKQVFTTPNWLLNKSMMARVDYGVVNNRIMEMQNQVLTSLLETYGFARMIDDEIKNGNNAYTVNNLLTDLRVAIFSNETPDVFKRALQRSYADRLGVLLKLDKPVVESSYAIMGITPYNPNSSDMRLLVRAELKKLNANVKALQLTATTPLIKSHYEDLADRINKILNPKI